MSVLGIDIGSSGCKASVVDAEGKIAGQAYREYRLSSPAPGMEEIDPELVWSSTKIVIALAVKAAGGGRANPIQAISVSSFGEAVVPTGADGRPLRNAILYIDPRGAAEAKAMGEGLGFARVHAITGAPVHSMYSIAKILWIKGHEPDVYRATRKFLLLAA
jgi:xylulokinase